MQDDPCIVDSIYNGYGLLHMYCLALERDSPGPIIFAASASFSPTTSNSIAYTAKILSGFILLYDHFIVPKTLVAMTFLSWVSAFCITPGAGLGVGSTEGVAGYCWVSASLLMVALMMVTRAGSTSCSASWGVMITRPVATMELLRAL